MINIELNNNKFKVTGNRKVLNIVYQAMKVKHPGQFYLRPHMKRGWDGCIDYLTEYGYANTGLLKRVTSLIESCKEEYIIEDSRKLLEKMPIPSKVGDFIAREYQLDAAKAIVNNSIGGVPYPRGVINAATNAGKTLIAALIHYSFKGARTIILINNKPLFEQFLDDMPKLYKDWGYMQGKNIKWGEVMLCMTPTLRGNIAKYQRQLASYNVMLFDECHLVTSKTNKNVIKYLINTIVRVGLSGTPFDHKDKTKNMDVEAFFGAEVFKISNIELMDLGFSTPIVVKIIKGNTVIDKSLTYPEEYDKLLIFSKERNEIILNRIKFNLKRKRVPMLVLCKFHNHVEGTHELLTKNFPHLKISFLHHKVKTRQKVLQDFKDGKTDIMVASLLIKLGQNMPLIKLLLNIAGGDSHINAKQIIGRLIRKDDSKYKVYYEDIWDFGKYLERHSRHRVLYYRKEKFKVIFVDKDLKQRYFRYARENRN